jgi:peptidoglycan/xylan/chitin deacetylase (PgdA/CDA1 family)
MHKATIALLTLTLLITACGNTNVTGQEQSPSTSPSPAVSAAVSPIPSPSATQTSTPTSAITPSPSPSPEVKEVDKQYFMNKNYDIVPIDPNGDKKVVLLTFDDGPKDKEMNEALIAILAKHKAKAIFFLNGYRIKQKPELLKLLHNHGQIIGNHSWDHINLKEQTNDKIDHQVDDVQNIVKELIGEAPQFFRPPHGSGNDYLKDKVKSDGLLYMTWSNGSLDWEMSTKNNDPSKVVANVLKQLHNGSNILMHELPWTVAALDQLLTELTEKGYSFVDPRAIELTAK